MSEHSAAILLLVSASRIDPILHAAAIQVEAEMNRLEERAADLEEALRDLHAEVEMAESVGICLPDRVPSLKAGTVLAGLPSSTLEKGDTP